ncbi:hypothetical protein M5K25_021338 [Dendrobium thyrsiflorum]|uniref:Uncharacterized protein n=1 Tax=Dendrobium thyrsiflorum TaxID=117978 RepID=A0ABD0UJ48_DENTH
MNQNYGDIAAFSVHPYEIFGLDRLDELDSSSAVHQVVEHVQNEISEHAKLQENEVKSSPISLPFILTPLKTHPTSKF